MFCFASFTVRCVTMNRLRRTLSFRKKSKCSKYNHAEDWIEDERRVRAGVCCFKVKVGTLLTLVAVTG